MTFDTHGRTMMGLTPAAAMALRAGLAARPVAFGANCGIGPAQLVESVLGLARAADPDEPIVAKGNCGIPRYLDGLIHYDGSPAVMAEYACLARDAGAKIIGGCCGTTPLHVRAMAEALAGRPRGPVPDRALIEERLGPLDRLPAAGGEPGRERRSRRRRRAIGRRLPRPTAGSSERRYDMLQARASTGRH
jgi:5-methyltetrahydrofolate--homocysteine methyltransferase